MTDRSVSEFRPVYTFEGPPHIEMQVADARRGEVTYLQHRVVVQQGLGGVVVVPVSTDRVGLVRIYRPTLDSVELELPRGFADSSDPAAEAARELSEETGLRPSRLRDLGTFILDSGLVPTSIAAFEASVDAGAPSVETDGETDGLVWLDRDDVTQAVRSGKIRDAISLTALALAGRPLRESRR